MRELVMIYMQASWIKNLLKDALSAIELDIFHVIVGLIRIFQEALRKCPQKN